MKNNLNTRYHWSKALWCYVEYGYSHQVIRLAKHIAKVRRFTYY